MDRPYHIRPAQVSDLPKLKDVEIASAKRFAGLGLIDHLLHRSLDQEQLANWITVRQVWVACKDDEIVGFTAVSIVDGAAYCEEMDVVPEHGKRGIGSQLIKCICDWARSKNLSALLLSTFRSIPWNAPFYERLGFEILSEDQLTAKLKQIRSKEESGGLPVEKRVFMRLRLGVKPSA